MRGAGRSAGENECDRPLVHVEEEGVLDISPGARGGKTGDAVQTQAALPVDRPVAAFLSEHVARKLAVSPPLASVVQQAMQ